MTREEQINQELKTRHETPHFNAGFVEGAHWADAHPHWISVKDRKPKLKHSDDNTKYSDTVIVTNGKYRTSARWLYSTYGGWYGWYDDGDEEVKGVTHWMPLPAPPKKGGEE